MFQVYKDDRVERLRETETVPPCDDSQLAVRSKDKQEAGLPDMAKSSKLNPWSLDKSHILETEIERNQLNKYLKELTGSLKWDGSVMSPIPLRENHDIPLTANKFGSTGDVVGFIFEATSNSKQKCGGGVVVLLAERDKEEMDMDISKLHFDFMRTYVLCRSGSPLILADLKKGDKNHHPFQFLPSFPRLVARSDRFSSQKYIFRAAWGVSPRKAARIVVLPHKIFVDGGNNPVKNKPFIWLAIEEPLTTNVERCRHKSTANPLPNMWNPSGDSCARFSRLP
ncbi:hypothetical protein F3Y22_tig00021542pilonHSYRG00002 [Hibiscus syriacus]|uniref:Uncharacterized protein n=1 Tax=Hibiscus syriacus TaxID=106335 RepID=A0A6A3BUA2_HIBSY|nr:hypothetical protein F3Y22_tig00021542pilonHSYRG00002 [Hibiscus syriacus]